MGEFRPSQLLFTQNSINSLFDSGISIHSEIERIKSLWPWNRNDALENFLPLEAGQDKYDGKWYCNNNRRLYMFRVLERQGYVTTIRTVRRGLRPKTDDVGCHVRLRGGMQPLPHCPCKDGCCLM